MGGEVKHVLVSMRDPKTIREFLARQSKEGVTQIFDILKHTDESTENLWLDAYSTMMSYTK